uniref:uncharacterized protein LOC122579568 n=1 Tax=Erigeron canadensis TaxID=72917 RepID=UPI001CB9B6B9|nr:uncharacterized protein LOC122579568 [Erigeron canadensis]
MMNGEGTSKVLPLNVPNNLDHHELLLVDKVNDEGSSVSSRYSSCGESEFDRYCSANSVMGTPSLCGSVGTFQDFPDSDIGSVKSSRLGDVGGLESFSLGGKFERSNNLLGLGRLGEYSKRNGERSEQGLAVVDGNEMNLYDEMDTSFSDFPDGGGVVMWKAESDSKRMESCSSNDFFVKNKRGEKMEEVNVVNVGVEESTEARMGESNVFEGGRQFDECSEEETLSRLEHSESEGSMYGYGTDGEELNGLPFRGYRNYLPDKKKIKEETLLMNSSVAYGSDDWDDYMQEPIANPQDLFVVNEIQGHDQKEIGSEEEALKSMSHVEENVNHFTMSSQADVSNTQSISHIDHLRHEEEEQEQLMKDMCVIAKQAENLNQFKMEEVSQVEAAPLMLTISDETTNNLTVSHVQSTSTQDTEISDETTNNLTVSHVQSTSTQDTEDYVAEMPKDYQSYLLQSLPTIKVDKRQSFTHVSLNVPEDVHMEIKAENYELNEFYDEVVFDMEEILLDSGESPAARFTRNRKHNHSHVSLPSRDGGSTASTSSIENSLSVVQNPYKIDGIEVIGAKQMKGDVSLGERLVGVKEYTVYKLRVWSGTHQWEVERRYRDFFTLYRRLKTSFANKGWDLPSPWSTVERESRKYFGNSSPDVVSERSVLIQECLQSILQSKFSSSLPNTVLWFLSPPKNGPNFPVFDTHISSSQIGSKPVYSLGQSISLIVEVRPHKSMRQMLEGQHYTCAGCHKYFDEGKTRLLEFVQTLGWGKPRVCEYSGQVFCSSCHINETAILPARVLHWWDFTEYPVSQLAKSYLDSIHDKPMLCVSALNPFLFAKVPPLQHVINVRKRIGRMLPYVRCPFRRSIYKGVGSRRYLLESSDFFALKDLVDLSKGVFAALPVMVETISKKIVHHITDECLICYDVGVPCGARQACDDPASLIFPFQEGEVQRCKSCELVYHKGCLKKMAACPCGVDLRPISTRNPNVNTNEVHVSPNNLVQDTESKSSVGFISGLLLKASPAKFWRTKDNDTVIPMGSLPSSSL